MTRKGLRLIFYIGWHGLTYIDLVNPVFTENDRFDPKQLKAHFYPCWHGLTCIDPMSSVLMGKWHWLEKNIFWILNFELFFLFFWIKIEIKWNMRKVLENPKLGYYKALFSLDVDQNDAILNQNTSFESKHIQNTLFHLNNATLFRCFSLN